MADTKTTFKFVVARTDMSLVLIDGTECWITKEVLLESAKKNGWEFGPVPDVPGHFQATTKVRLDLVIGSVSGEYSIGSSCKAGRIDV